MSQLIYSNQCIRCGKQRIVSKVKKEKIGGSYITTTFTSCPDPECQKIVDKKLAVEKKAREKLLNDSKQRELDRKKKIQLTLGSKRKKS